MGDLQTIDRALSEIHSLVEQGKFEEAQNRRKETLEISEEAIKNATSKEEKARIELKRGIIYNDLGQISTARRSLLLALAIFTELGNRKGEIDIYNELARIHFVRSEYNNAISYLDMCIALSKEIQYEEGMVKAIGNRSRVYTLKGELQSAEKDFLFGIEARKKVDSSEINLSKALQSLAYVYYLQRRFEEAKGRLEESYAIIEELRSILDVARDEAVYYEYLGALSTAQGDFDSAHKNYYKVFEIMMPLAPYSDMISQTYRLLAELQIKEKKYDEALSSCEEGLKIAKKIGERIEVGAIHRALGQIYSAKADKKKAKEHFEKSVSLLKEIGAKYELGLAHIEAGSSDAFDYADRIVYLGNAKEIFKEIAVDYYVEKASRLRAGITKEPPITKREELNGYVERIIDDMAYIVLKTPGGPLERAIEVSKLEAIHAARRGALINFVVEERGANMNIKFENLEEKGIRTWRDEIEDEELEKI